MRIPGSATRSTCSARCACSSARALRRSSSRTRISRNAAAICATRALISAAEMAGKIRAAVDARDRRADHRAHRCDRGRGVRARRSTAPSAIVEAGADILFIEAPETAAQMQAIARRFAGARAAARQHGGGRPHADRLGGRARRDRVPHRHLPGRHGARADARRCRTISRAASKHGTTARVPRPHASISTG